MSDRSTAVYDDLAIEPDSEFELALRRHLDARLREPWRVSRPEPSDNHVELDVDFDMLPSSRSLPPDDSDRHRRRRSTLSIAAAIAASIGIGLAVGRATDDDLVNTPTVTAPMSTTTAPTESVPPVDSSMAAPTTEAAISMDELASIRAMMWNDDFFLAGYLPIEVPSVTLDGSLAADLPACEPFLATVFESEARPAVIRYKAFGSKAHENSALQYVAVHPSVAQATAMLDSMQDPAFLAECLPAYKSLQALQRSDDTESLLPIGLGEEIEPPTIAVDVDDMWVRAYWADLVDDHGNGRGREVRVFAALRVGSIVTMIDLTAVESDGEGVATNDDVERLVRNMANRAQIARHGP
jgi:hypothetical protein